MEGSCKDSIVSELNYHHDHQKPMKSRLVTLESCRFDPVADRISMCKPMSTPRFALASSVLKGSIICIGGFDGQKHLASSERLDPRAGR